VVTTNKRLRAHAAITSPPFSHSLTFLSPFSICKSLACQFHDAPDLFSFSGIFRIVFLLLAVTKECN
jgi:hypothetical protein